MSRRQPTAPDRERGNGIIGRGISVTGIFSSAPSAALRAPRFLLLKADQGSRRAAEDAEKKQ